MLHLQHPCILQTCFISPYCAWCGDSGEFRPNYFFFFCSLQSTRNTDCVKARTIWIYTSKWSGCTTNTFVICLPSREKCLNIQREFSASCSKSPLSAFFCYLGSKVAIWFSCGCFQDTSFLTSQFSVFVCLFVPSGVCATAPHPAHSIIVQYHPTFPKLSNGMDRL